MGKFNEDVIGEKIIYKGHSAIIEDFVSCYEGDYWDIKVEGVIRLAGKYRLICFPAYCCHRNSYL